MSAGALWLAAVAFVAVTACGPMEESHQLVQRANALTAGEGAGSAGTLTAGDPTRPGVAPEVSTDKQEYQPGETAAISGAGYASGEPILVQVKHEGGEAEEGAGHEPWMVTAGQDGAFSTSWHVPPSDSQGSTFVLSTDTAAGLHAEMIFNDAATTVTLNLYDSGWYANNNYSNTHDPSNKNYFAGTGQGNILRNYFVFDLSSVTGKITSATLRATNPYGSGPSQTYALYDVVTPVSQLMTGNSPSTWTDLGSGTLYGSQFISSPSANPITISLNGAALAALQANIGKLFAVGGDYANSNTDNFIFGFSSGGRGSSAVQLILQTVPDMTPPVITVPSAITTEATRLEGAVVTYSASAVDDFDGPVEASCNPASGSVFPLDTTTVTCRARDSVGNASYASFTITVRDTTAPTFGNVPSNIVAEAKSAAGAAVSFASPIANDLVDGLLAVSCAPASGETFAFGVTTVGCTATDRHGNSAVARFAVSVVDTTPPALRLPSGLIAEATGPSGASVSFAADADDLVDGAVAATCSYASGESFPLGSTTVSCTAQDAHGNVASGTFAITVQDTTPPALSVPGSMMLTATSASGAFVSYQVSASDQVDGAIVPTCTQASSSMFAPGTTTVSCSATDLHGNVGTARFTVTVAFSWSNLLAPVNTAGSSIFKLGSTVPVKFRLTGASAGIDNAVAQLYVAKISDNISGTELEAESTAAADSGNTFRYSASDSQYIFNLSTKSLQSGTWQLRVDLGDGVSHTVQISLKQ